MKVLLRAPLLTLSGYGIHSRQIFKWLNEKNIDLTVECLNWGETPWLLNQNEENGLIGEIMKKSVAINPPYDLSIQVQLPDEWDPTLAAKNIGITAAVETDRCSPKWVEACNKMDKVIVPSNFTKSVIKRSGIVMTQIAVIHEWYNEHLDEEIKIVEDERYKFDTDFNFLLIGQLTGQTPETDRKNIENTLKWLIEEFENEKNTGIVIKTNLGKGSTVDLKHTKFTIKSIIEKYRKGSFPKIHLIHGNMKNEEIAKLYNINNVKCFVTATRGEGYGLPIVDAARSGIPIVATNWSGHLDFVGENILKVDYQLKDISEQKIDNRIFFENFKWAEPKEESFKQKIREVYENYNMYKETAEKNAIFVKNNFSKQKIKKDYDKEIPIT